MTLNSLLTVADYVPPKVVEIPEVISAIQSITQENGLPPGSVTEPPASFANVYPWYPQQQGYFITELETRLGALCEKDTTAKPYVTVALGEIPMRFNSQLNDPNSGVPSEWAHTIPDSHMNYR